MNKEIIRKSFELAKQDIKSNSEEVTKLKKEIIQIKNHLYVLEEKAGTRKITEEPNNELKNALRGLLKEMQGSSAKSAGIFGKKNAMKNKILEFLNKNQVDLPRLKQVFVDEQQHCSKASFYRYVEELKKENRISPTKEKVMVTA